MNVDITSLIRKNIVRLVPYSSARSEHSATSGILLDANENSYGSPIAANLHRYPDPKQRLLKIKLSEMNGLPESSCFIGNGSDEVIDLLIRSFCEPAIDNIIVCRPTYRMYEVSAEINDVTVHSVPLTDTFQLDVERIFDTITPRTKLIFLCSPNNPSGNLLHRADVLQIVQTVSALVVVDEAYWDFAAEPSFAEELNRHNNLIILRTMSKAWGLAGLRIGLAFASPEIVAMLNKVKPPYNVNSISQRLALQVLNNANLVRHRIDGLVKERKRLQGILSSMPSVTNVFPSDANFLLVRFKSASNIYMRLLQAGIVVRDRSTEAGCEGCLRITIGRKSENNQLIDMMKEVAE